MSRDVRITEIRSWNGMYCIPSSVSDHRITMIVDSTKPGNSVNPNLSLHNKGYFITCTILEAHQYYHGYVVNANADRHSIVPFRGLVTSMCSYIQTTFLYLAIILALSFQLDI